MNNSRINLQNELEELIHLRNVYFQPPENTRMEYPCIVYELDDIYVRRADDRAYHMKNRYNLTVIDKNVESPIPDMLIKHFPMCSFDRFFVSGNMNHFVLTLYY